MSFCTQCGKLLQEGLDCDCAVVKLFCTQCGKPLSNGQVCECAAVTMFCTKCGNLLVEGQACPCIAVMMPETEHPRPESFVGIEQNFQPASPVNIEQVFQPEPKVIAEPPHGLPPSSPRPQSSYIEEPTIGKSIRNISKAAFSPLGIDNMQTQLVPEHVSAISGEIPVKQYHVAHMRNLLRINRTAGYLEVTSKRVIFRAEKRFFSKKTIIQREHSIESIAGIEAVSNYRLSATRAFIGLITLVAFAALAAAGVLWLTHGSLRAEAYIGYFMARPPIYMVLQWAYEGLREGWAHDIGSISLGVGLVAGFGGVALFFLLRGKFWFKLIFLGVSVGGFGASALTYNLYAFVLLVLSILFAVFGLALFAWLPDLVISAVSKEGRAIRLVYGRRLLDILHGSAGAGYAEAAPTVEAEDAIRELGAVIRDIQVLGIDGAKKWGDIGG